MDLTGNLDLFDTTDGDNPISIAQLNSDYCAIDDIAQLLQTGNRKFKIMHLNIQSLPAKFEQLKVSLDYLATVDLTLDCILLCETYLNNLHCDLYNIPGHSFVQRCRSSMNNGGVAIHISDKIPFKIREDLSLFIEGEFESIVIETCLHQRTCLIAEVYRVLDTNETASIECLIEDVQ